MPGNSSIELKQEVKLLLKYGRAHATTGETMAQRLHFKNDRLIRLAIRDLIAEGKPILSSIRPPYGYYLPDSPNDITEHLEDLRHRALEILGRYKDLKLASRDILQSHQMALI